MATTRLTRKVRFSAAHRYWRPEWDEERNRRVFGKCSNPHGHGHNYLLEVTVEGEVDPRTGFVIDLGVFDELLETEVIFPLDHRHLNHRVERFGPGGEIPTSENLAAYLWQRLVEGLPTGVRLRRLRLHEDDTFYVDYHGESEAEVAAGAAYAANAEDAEDAEDADDTFDEDRP